MLLHSLIQEWELIFTVLHICAQLREFAVILVFMLMTLDATSSCQKSRCAGSELQGIFSTDSSVSGWKISGESKLEFNVASPSLYFSFSPSRSAHLLHAEFNMGFAALVILGEQGKSNCYLSQVEKPFLSLKTPLLNVPFLLCKSNFLFLRNGADLKGLFLSSYFINCFWNRRWTCSSKIIM